MRALVVVAALTALPASAHFWLEAPDASFVLTQPYGDPQKTAPCGNDGAPVASNQVTTVTAGDLLTVRVRETIFHPGHYRVALGLNGPSDLPAAPPVTPTAGDACGSTTVQNPPVFPVIADGQLMHSAPFNGSQSFAVRIPANVTCTNCTLQVIEYMSSHGAPCFYYHCANLRILAPDAGMSTGGGSAGTGGGAAGGTTGTGGGTAGGTTGTGGGTAGGTTGTGGGTTGTGGGSAGGSATTDGGMDPAQMAGCGCSASGFESLLLVALALGAGRLARRRR